MIPFPTTILAFSFKTWWWLRRFCFFGDFFLCHYPSWRTGKPNKSWVILLWCSLCYLYNISSRKCVNSDWPFLRLCTAAILMCLQLPGGAISSHNSMALYMFPSCLEMSFSHLFIWLTATYPLRSNLGFIPYKKLFPGLFLPPYNVSIYSYLCSDTSLNFPIKACIKLYYMGVFFLIFTIRWVL